MAMSILFWYFVGYWIALGSLGIDEEGIDKYDVMLCLAYPIILGIIIPYYLIAAMISSRD